MWNRIGSLIVALGVLAAWAAPAAAASAMRLTIEPQSLGVGDDALATVTIDGKASMQPELVGADGFDVAGRSTQSSVQWINGSLSVSRQIVFTLRARREGRFNIAAAAGRNGADRSNAVAVVVVAGSAGAQRGAPPARPNGPPAAPPAPDREQRGKPFFIQAVVRPTTAYPGQQVTVEYDLHVRADVQAEKFELDSAPEFVGFTQRELPSSTKLAFVDETIGGTAYRATPVKRYALFPMAPGEGTVGGFGMRIQYVRRSDRPGRNLDPFAMFPSLMRERDVAEVASDPVKITVQPLPTEGQPPDFNGAVGRYDIKAEVDRTDVPVGEPFTLNLTISGDGDVETVHRPKENVDANLRVYSDKDRAEVTPTFDKIAGKKIFETIFIASAPGNYEIPALRLPYFDPDARQYKTAASAPVAVRATGEAQAGASKSLQVVSREAVELRGRDLRYIRRDKPALQMRSTAWAAQPILWIALALWPLLAAGVVIYQIRQGRLRADRGAYRSRRALKEARQRLQAARAAIDGDPAQFYAEIHRAVIGFIADKLDAAAPGLSRGDLARSLQEKGLRPESLARLDALWGEADAVRFGGQAAAPEARRASLENAGRLLADLVQELTR